MPNPISIKTIANKGKVFDLTARTDVIALIGYVAPLTTKRALETRTPSCSKKICSLISAPDSVSLTSKLRGAPLAARPLERSVRRFNLNESRFVHSGHRWHPGCECRCHHLARRSCRVCGYRFLLLAHR